MYKDSIHFTLFHLPLNGFFFQNRRLYVYIFFVCVEDYGTHFQWLKWFTFYERIPENIAKKLITPPEKSRYIYKIYVLLYTWWHDRGNTLQTFKHEIPCFPPYDISSQLIFLKSNIFVTGGETLTLSGSNFDTSSSLTIGDTAVSITSITTTTVTAVLPTMQPGNYPIKLSGSSGLAVDG